MKFKVFLVVMCLPILATGVLSPLMASYLNEQEVTIAVKHKERVVKDKDSMFLIWTDEEVFKDTDSLIKGKFGSSDLYGRLEVGRVYTCKVYGWRVQLFSWYRNVIECTEVADGSN